MVVDEVSSWPLLLAAVVGAVHGALFCWARTTSDHGRNQGYLHAVPQVAKNHQTIAFPCQLRDDGELDWNQDLSKWQRIVMERFAAAERSAAPASAADKADRTAADSGLQMPASLGPLSEEDRLLRVRRQVRCLRFSMIQ